MWSHSKLLLIAALAVVFLFTQINCQPLIYDGYPTNFNQIRAFRRDQQSFIRFNNVIDHQSNYLASYTYEVYMRLRPTESDNRTFRGVSTILDCFNFVEVTISRDRLMVWQAAGATCEYRFDLRTAEFQTLFLNQWVHYAISYSNYNIALGQQMALRLFFDGNLYSECRIKNAPTVNTSIGRGKCVVGNSFSVAQSISQNQNRNVSSTTGLSADVAYLQILSLPRQSKFNPTHRYPIHTSGSLLYLRFDSEFPLTDWYLNRSSHLSTDSQLFRADIQNIPEPRYICECYGQPLKVITANNQSFLAQNISLNSSSNRLLVEVWIKVWEGKGISNIGEVFAIEKVIRARVGLLGMQILVGDENRWRDVSGFRILFRQWTQIGINLNNKEVSVFLNGEKLYYITSGSQIKLPPNPTLTFNLNPLGPQFTVSFYRLRLSQQSLMIMDDFFRWSFLDGSNSDYQRLNYSSNDFLELKFTDLQLTAPQYISGNLLRTAVINNLTLPRTAQYEFRFDNTICGDYQNVWVENNTFGQGQCSDKRWYPLFQNNKTTFKARLQVMGPEITIEVWVRPTENRRGCIVAVEEGAGSSRKERFRIEVSNNSIQSNYSTVIMQANTSQGQQWLHVAFQTSNRLNITVLLVFEFNTQKLNIVNASKSSVFKDMIMPVLATTYLGNSPFGNSPFNGMMREIRIWSIFRSEKDLSMMRNIELQTGASNLLHYFKMVGDTDNLKITDYNSYFKRTESISDFSITNTLPIDSPMIFDQDFTDFSVCPSSLYLNMQSSSSSCLPPLPFNHNLISYLNPITNVITVTSGLNFTSLSLNPQPFLIIFSFTNATNIARNKLQAYLADKSQLLMQGQPQCEFESFKIDDSPIEVQMRISNTFYPALESVRRVWVNPKCPGIDVQQMDLLTGSVTLYFQEGVEAQRTISINPTIDCFQTDKFLDLTSIKYQWSLSRNQSSLKIGFNSNNMRMTVQNQKNVPIAKNFSLKIVASMFYINKLIRPTPLQISKEFNLKVTSDPIVLMFVSDTAQTSTTSNNFIFTNNNPNIVINASLSLVIHPDYIGSQVRFQADCPRTLFKTSDDFRKWCFMDFRGILTMPLSSLNLIPFQIYNVSITGNVRFQERLNVSQTVFFSFAPLTPIGQECPSIQFPAYYNVSKYDLNARNTAIQVFPSTLNLVCQRTGGYVATYTVKNVTWDTSLSDDSVIQQKEQGLYGIVKNSALLEMPVGKVISVSMIFNLESNEGKVNMSAGSELRIIQSDFQLQVQGLKSIWFNETVSINITGTFDPEDPGTKLVYNWVCPSWVAQKSLCPSNSNPLILKLSIEHKIALLWRYARNNTLWLQVQNPKSNKQQLLNLTVYLESIPMTVGVGLCPSYDFNGNQALKKNFTDDNYYVTVTNDFSDIYISQPSLKLNCQKQAQLLSVYFMDESDGRLLNAPPLMQILTQGIKIDGSKLSSLDFDTEYRIGVYMYYRLSGQPNDIKIYLKYIIVKRLRTDGVLIAQFREEQVVVKANSSTSAVIDASLSRDSGNAQNTNFSFKWECSKNFPMNLCPQNSSLLQLTSEMRKKHNLDIPGSFFTFRVQIFDNNRTSQWTSCSLLITPPSGSDCVTLNPKPAAPSSFQLSSPLVYPLITPFTLSIQCPGLVFNSLDTYTNTSDADISLIKVNSTLFQLITSIQSNTSVTQRINYQINQSVYQSTIELQSNISSKEVRLKKYPNKIYIDGVSIANLDFEGLVLRVNEDNGSAPLSWKCEGKLGIDAKCSFHRGNQIRIVKADIRLQVYQQILNRGDTIRIDASSNEIDIQPQFIYFTNLNRTIVNQYQNCKIRHSQEDSLDISRATYLTLFCDRKDRKFYSLNWTLTNARTFQMIRLNSVTDKAAIIHRYQMDYNQEYYANATLRLDKNNAEMLKFTIAINTFSNIPSMITLGRGVQFTSFNSSFGYFFQSLFNITLSKDAFSIDSKTQQPLTLYYSVDYQDLEGTWVCLQPQQPSLKPLLQLAQLNIPRFQRMRAIITDSYGNLLARDLSPDIYVNQTFQYKDINQTSNLVEGLNNLAIGQKQDIKDVLGRIRLVNFEIKRYLNSEQEEGWWWGDSTPAAQMMAKSALLFTKGVKGKDLSNEEQELAITVLLQFFEDENLTKLMFHQDLNNNLNIEFEAIFNRLNQSIIPQSLEKGYLLTLPPDSPLVLTRGTYQIQLYRMLNTDSTVCLNFSQTSITFNQTTNNYLSYKLINYQKNQTHLQFIGDQYILIEVLDRNVETLATDFFFQVNVTFFGLTKEEWENGTCSWYNGSEWNIDITSLKLVQGEIQCTLNTTGYPVGVVMLDRITGMPIVISDTPKESSKVVVPFIIDSKIEQYTIARVLFILASSFFCLVFIFIQILACYAAKQDQKYYQLKSLLPSNKFLKRLEKPEPDPQFSSIFVNMIKFNLQLLNIITLSLESLPSIIIRTQLFLTTVYLYLLTVTLMVVYPQFYDKPYIAPGISFVLMIALNLLKNQLYAQYQTQGDTLNSQQQDNNVVIKSSSSQKGNSTRRLFSRSQYNNTLFTQEEENKRGEMMVVAYGLQQNVNEHSISQATESYFQSIEQAQGRQIARATIQLTKSPDVLKRMDQSQGLKLWQTSAKRRRTNKNFDDASPYTFKDILNQEAPQQRMNIKVIEQVMEEDEKNEKNLEDVDLASCQQEEGHRQLQINEFKNQLAATHQELRLAYPFQDGSEDSKSRRISMSELDINSRGVQETEIGPSHPHLEPRRLLETETCHLPTLISPRNVELEFEQPPEKFTTLKSPLRTDMILGNTLKRQLAFQDQDSNQSVALNVEPRIQEEKFSTGLNQMKTDNTNQQNRDDPTQSFSSIFPLNRVKIMSASKDIPFESDNSNNVGVNIATTEQEEQQQQRFIKPISVTYWLTHALLVNCGLLIITLLLWDKRLRSEKYDEGATSGIVKVFLYWLAISLCVNIAVEIIFSAQIALQLRSEQTPSKIMELIVFGGDFSYKFFKHEFTRQKRDGSLGNKSETQPMTKEDSSQKDVESHRRLSKQVSRRSQNLQRKRLRHLIKS